MDSRIITDQEVFDQVLDISMRYRRLVPSKKFFEPGEFEQVLNSLIGLIIQRGRRIIQLCQHLDSELLKTFIPDVLSNAANSYLINEWRPLNKALDMFFDDVYSLPKEMDKTVDYYDLQMKVDLIINMVHAIGNLEHLLKLENPLGEFDLDEFDDPDFDEEFPRIIYNTIEPRTAILEIHKILASIETVLNQFADMCEDLRNTASEHNEVRDEKPQTNLQRPLVGDIEFLLLHALYNIKQAVKVGFIRNEANELGTKCFKNPELAKYFWSLQKTGLCELLTGKLRQLTPSGIKFVETDVRFNKKLVNGEWRNK